MVKQKQKYNNDLLEEIDEILFSSFLVQLIFVGGLFVIGVIFVVGMILKYYG